MQVTKKNLSDTKVSLSISVDTEGLKPYKDRVLNHLKGSVKVPGFRDGKAPPEVIEKHLDPNVLQTEFLDEALTILYRQALEQENLRPVARPEIQIKKFVPYTELEFEAEVETIGEIKLPDYRKIKKSKPSVIVTDKDVDEVLQALAKRAAERKESKAPAEENNEVVIDFSGKDEKGGPVKGADGKDYPLILGSKTFIPGFEENLAGLKAGENKTFTVRFPKDYGVKALANKKITFAAKVKKVNEIIEPKIDNELASKVSPFKTLNELRDDIKKQLAFEREQEAGRALEGEIVKEITDKTKLKAPKVLVDEQVEVSLRQLKQNLTYRGLTFHEFLEGEGKSEEQYIKEVVEPEAEERVKASLVLAEIADKEGLSVSNEELDQQILALKSQYKDAAMQAELDKPESRGNISSRILTQKVLEKLKTYAASK